MRPLDDARTLTKLAHFNRLAKTSGGNLDG